MLGIAYAQLGKYELAIPNLTKAVELRPNDTDVLNNLAWVLATANDVPLQNATKATEYAARACKLTGYNRPELLDTLAVAYASAGKFEEAKAIAGKALSIARAADQKNLAAEIERQIKLYEAGQPYQQK